MSAPRANEVYTRRLNDSLELLERNFRGLVEAARVDLSAGAGPSAEHDRDLMQIDLNTANIVRRRAPPAPRSRRALTPRRQGQSGGGAAGAGGRAQAADHRERLPAVRPRRLASPTCPLR